MLNFDNIILESGKIGYGLMVQTLIVVSDCLLLVPSSNFAFMRYVRMIPVMLVYLEVLFRFPPPLATG